MDAPGRWLGSTPLLDLEDPRLRRRAASLVQLCRNDREKALAIYGSVKRMTYLRPFKLGPRTAREVLDAGAGDGPDKATLMIALLRLSGVPARLRVVVMRGEIMRGLVDHLKIINRPFVEAYVGGQWMRTDTYIFDATYMAAARQALKAAGATWGYGVHVEGPMLWTGLESMTNSPLPFDQDPMVIQDMGCFHDAADYMASAGFRARHVSIARYLRWNLMVPSMRRAADRIRNWSGPRGQVDRVSPR